MTQFVQTPEESKMAAIERQLRKHEKEREEARSADLEAFDFRLLFEVGESELVRMMGGGSK